MFPLLRAALVIALSFSVFGTAVGAAQESLGKPVVDVVVEGEAATLITPGELHVPSRALLSRQLVRELIQRLIATGRWTDIQVSTVDVSGGVRLSVALVARALLARVDIRGVSALDVSEVNREIDLAAGAQLSAELIEQTRTRLALAYARRGYRAAQAKLIVRETDDPTRKVLLIEVDEGEPTRIGRIVVRGEHPLDRSALYRALPFSVGDVLDETLVADGVRRAEKRLRRAGYLEATLSEANLRVDGPRAEVAFAAQIGPLYRVEVAGQEPMARGEVLQAMALGEEPLTTSSQVSAVVDRVTDLYRRKGFVDAKVELQKVAERRAGRAVLRVRVTPGQQLDVVAIGFPGARHFEPGFLEAQVISYLDEELPGAGLLSPVDSDVADDAVLGPGDNERATPVPPHSAPARTFYAPTYDSAVEHIQQLYQAEGFLSAKVGPVQLQRASNRHAAVAVPITEGPRTMLHEVTLTGNEALGAQELVTESSLRRSMPFSYLALEDARSRLLQLYRERGYLYAKVEPTVRFSQDRTRAEVTIQIVERYQVHVDGIVIKGASRTDESLIRDLVAFQPGDIYRPSIAQESEERLLALGVFSGVTIAPEDADLPARSKRVEVSVTQRPSQVIDLKAGISTGQGVRGGLEYGYRDLFGQAVSLTLRAEIAYQLLFFQQSVADNYNALILQDRLERSATLSLVVPQLMGPLPVRTSFELFHVRDNQRSFGFDKNGFGIGLTYQPVRRVTLSFNADLENNNIDLFRAGTIEERIMELMDSTDPQDQAELRILQLMSGLDGNAILVAGRWSVNYEHRDNPLNPTRGYMASLSSEVATTLQTEEARKKSRYLKLSATISGYVPLGSRVVLALQGRVGYIVHLLPQCVSISEESARQCSQTYPNRAYFMGGVDTMRGYSQDAVVPQDQVAQTLASKQTSPNAIVQSGDAFVLYRSELRFPLAGDLHGAIFADVGNLWRNARLIDPFQIRTSVGAGLRLGTPVGPLAFDYGIVVGARRELYEPIYGTVHFSMGLF